MRGFQWLMVAVTGHSSLPLTLVMGVTGDGTPRSGLEQRLDAFRSTQTASAGTTNQATLPSQA